MATVLTDAMLSRRTLPVPRPKKNIVLPPLFHETYTCLACDRVFRFDAKPCKCKGSGKFRAKRILVGNTPCDSTKEGLRFSALLQEEADGNIGCLVVHPIYEMKVEGKLICRYEADFSYITHEGIDVAEDVKSPHTRTLATYRLKRKLFEALYPDIRFFENCPPKKKKERKKAVPA